MRVKIKKIDSILGLYKATLLFFVIKNINIKSIIFCVINIIIFIIINIINKIITKLKKIIILSIEKQ